jgi:phosphonate transport system permease protein
MKGSTSVVSVPPRFATDQPLGDILRRFLILAVIFLIIGQATVISGAQPEALLTGMSGIADIVSRSMPPAFDKLPSLVWPTVETIDVAIFGTVVGIVIAVPVAILAARNVAPAKPLYYATRAVVSFLRSVPELVWALIFVAAVGLGPFAGALALAFHSVGMLGRLFAEVIEDMDMGPVEALTLTGANRAQIFTHAVIPGVLPSLLGISLYRFDENLRSSVLLGFVGAGGIGFELLSSMSMFEYREVSVIILVILALVIGAERGSALLRRRIY